MHLGLVCSHVCGSASMSNSMSAYSSVLPVGFGVTQWEDLARIQRATRCEEDDFHRVSLQQPEKALWSAALRPRLWPHEQVRSLKAVLFHMKLYTSLTAPCLHCTTLIVVFYLFFCLPAAASVKYTNLKLAAFMWDEKAWQIWRFKTQCGIIKNQ